MSKLREVAGQTYDRDAFVRLICTTINDLLTTQAERFPSGGVQALDVIEAWGDPAWAGLAARSDINQELVDLCSRKRLIRHKRGHYSVSPHYMRAGNSGEDAIIQAVLRDLREAGGVLSFTEIRESFGIGPAPGSGPRTPLIDLKRRTARALTRAEDVRRRHATKLPSPEAGYLWRVIKKSPLLRRDFKRFNLINLPEDELGRLIQSGRVAYLRIWAAMREERTRRGERVIPINAIDEEAEAYFKGVGGVYRRARERADMTLGELYEHETMHDMVHTISVRHRFRAGFIQYMEARAAGRPFEGFEGALPRAFREAVGPEQWPLVMLAMYEDGDHITHVSMPMRFQATLAGLLRMDPVAASRGLLSPPGFVGSNIRMEAEPSDDTDDLETLDPLPAEAA